MKKFLMVLLSIAFVLNLAIVIGLMQMMFSPLRHALMNRSPVQMEWIPIQSWQGKSR